MSEAAHDVASLAVMTGVLSGNPAAILLARSLSEYFGFQLRCTMCEDDSEPSRHRIEGIRGPSDIGPVRIQIIVRKTERTVEALVHELLHARLIAIGYPTFWIEEEQGSQKWNLAGGIINNAEHVVMKPVFVSLGYDVARFLGPSKPLRDEHARIVTRLERAAASLASPEGYLRVVSAELRQHDVSFSPLHLAQHIAPAVNCSPNV